MQDALDVMLAAIKAGDWKVDGACDPDWVLNALRARLAHAEAEPVAWTVRGLITDFSRDFSAYQTKTYTVPLYTASPQREWVGLTTEEIAEQTELEMSPSRDIFDLRKAFWCGARWAEAKLMEKNT